MTDHGISIASIYNYVIYYGVIFLLLIPALIHGRRAACHYICWMAPFMVIGSSIGRFLHLPQLHIDADRDKCISYGKCSRVCPMGLDVKELVKADKNAKCTECIQCGACVDECPKSVLQYKFTWK
jgi:polyferredoxin